MNSNVVVIGGGVVGSFAAAELQRKGFFVTLFTDPVGRFAAPAGGIGIIEDQGLPGSDSGLITTQDLANCYVLSDGEWRGMASSPVWSDLVQTRPVTYLYRIEKDTASSIASLAPSCNGRHLRASDLSEAQQQAGFVCGMTFNAPIIYPKEVLARMHDQLKANGAEFVYERVPNLDRFESEPIVLETVGLGRRMFFGDNSIVPRRGQTMVLKGPHGLNEVLGAPGPDISFNIVPWDKMTLVLGATKELGSVDEVPSEETARKLLEGCAVLWPNVLKMRIDSNPVAFRPTRDKLLLERERSDNGGVIWRVNGFGGGGWSVAPGVAKQLVDMITAQ